MPSSHFRPRMCIYAITLPPWLNFTPTLPPQAGILKAGAAGIECSLKAKHVLVPVMVGAAAVQRFSLSSVLSSSRS